MAPAVYRGGLVMLYQVRWLFTLQGFPPLPRFPPSPLFSFAPFTQLWPGWTLAPLVSSLQLSITAGILISLGIGHALTPSKNWREL